MQLQICDAPPVEAYAASLLIPEFQPWYTWEKWEERLAVRDVISLVAKSGDTVAGFKTGYMDGGELYSWVGGVLPAFRRMGIAQMLANEQERRVRSAGVSRIRMKTRNRFTGMLQFALGNGFYIAHVDQVGDPADWRITLYKNL